MLDNIVARASVGRVTDPIARALVRRGVRPDVVTGLGTVGSVAASLWFLPRDQLFVGTCVITAFMLFDLLDGAMARVRGSGTRFGAVLDSTESVHATVDTASRLAYRAFANPVVKVLAVRAGAATGIRRLAGSDTDHPAALRNGQNGQSSHNGRNGHNGNGR